MLVLSRGLSQSVRIGPDIVVMITEIRPGQVRLGIEAPKDVIVEREELWEKKRKERMDNEANRDRLPPPGDEPPVC